MDRLSKITAGVSQGAGDAVADALAEVALAGPAVAPAGPETVMRTTGAPGLASAPAAGSVPVTVPGSPVPGSERMAAMV